MPDTVRTRAALAALLADNTAGDISAQDMRDFLASTGVYSSGSGAPGSAPASLFETYIDSSNGKVYMAKGTSDAADWLDVTASGGGGGWTTIFDGTPSAVALIEVDITGYSLIRWEVDGVQHLSISQQLRAHAYSSGSYNQQVSNGNNVAALTSVYGGGFLIYAGKAVFGYGHSGSTTLGASASLYYRIVSTLDPTKLGFFWNSGGNFVATGNIKVFGI